MAADTEPPELAQLLDTAERPRSQQWSFRAALTRYAQPQPQRSSAIIELLRRSETAVRPHAKTLARNGPMVWTAVCAASDSQADATEEGVDPILVDILKALAELDRLGDVLTTWAVDRSGDQPNAAVDATVARVTERLERSGVHREERTARPPGRRNDRGKRPET